MGIRINIKGGTTNSEWLCKKCDKSTVREDSNGQVDIHCGIFGRGNRTIVSCESFFNRDERVNRREMINNGTIINITEDGIMELGKGIRAFEGEELDFIYKDGKIFRKGDETGEAVGTITIRKRRKKIGNTTLTPVVQ